MGNDGHGAGDLVGLALVALAVFGLWLAAAVIICRRIIR